MSDRDLDRLQLEVEEARGRVIADIARLTAPGATTQLKRRMSSELQRSKDEWTAKAKEAATDRAYGILDEIKARAAANPAAALAIGAGLAWRLAHKPPIASLLVGAGLVGLLRTDPQRPRAGAAAAGRAIRMAGSAKERLDDWSGGDPRQRLADLAETVKDRVGELGADARAAAAETREKAARMALEAGDAVLDASAATREAVERAGGNMRRRAHAARSRTVSGANALYRRVPGGEDRDKVLLGAAAVALAAALGVAYQRRANGGDSRDSDDD
jgi:hypothetical protein